MTTPDAPRLLIAGTGHDGETRLTEMILARWPQARVDQTNNVANLDQVIEAHLPELLVCQLNSSLEEANSLLNAASIHSHKLPILVLFTPSAEISAQQVFRNGVRDYIERPNFQRLIAAIERELRTAALEREKATLEKAHLRAVFFDSMTGFLNQKGFKKSFDEFCHAEGNRQDLCLITVGLSRQTRKTVALSPLQQKNLIANIQSRLRTLFDKDIVCQWSDNLIVILLSGFDWSLPVAESTLERLSGIELELETPVIMDSFPVRPYFKIGLARPILDGTRAEELVLHARSVASALSSQNAPLIAAAQPDVHEKAKRGQTIAASLGHGI
ncbi:MAG: hypothetical protein R3194_09255, partial [Limnobacter sp.]|nr:hypothetical protein [Limnobacter sp.]